MIHPYGCIALDPASAVFHYALECFEGMKASIDAEGHVRLFRPDMNMMRLNNSMKRLLLPEFDGDELLKCLAKLIRLDKDWVQRVKVTRSIFVLRVSALKLRLVSELVARPSFLLSCHLLDQSTPRDSTL